MGRELGFEVDIARGFRLEGEVVSSSHLRRLIGEDGMVERASELMERDHSIEGVIVRGQGRGRKLGFPTANLEQIPEIVPAPGVYACRGHLGAAWFPAEVHVGSRLTFDDISSVEAHLVGWDHDRDLYDERLRLEFVEKLRTPSVQDR
jgi:riboflavin kinase/FMN adenylyltransferase